MKARHKISPYLILLLCPVLTASAQKPELVPQIGHIMSAAPVAFGLQDRIIISKGSQEEATLKVWEVGTGRLLLTMPGTELINVNPEGRLLATVLSGDVIKVWNLANGQEISGPVIKFQKRCGQVEKISFIENSEVLAIVYSESDECTDDVENRSYRLLAWDLATGRSRRRLTSLINGYPFSHRASNRMPWIDFSPNGRYLAISIQMPDREDRIVKLWDSAAGDELYTLQASSTIFSTDGKLLLSQAYREHGLVAVKLLEVSTGRELRSYQIKNLAHSAISPDNRLVAHGYVDESHKYRLKVWKVGDEQPLRDIPLPGGRSIEAILFSPDNRTVVVETRLKDDTDKKTIYFLDVGMGKVLQTFTIDWFSSFALSSDGKLFAGGDAERDNLLSLWETGSGTVKRLFTGLDFRGETFGFSPDGKTLASQTNIVPQSGGLSQEYVVRLWDLATGATTRAIKGEFETFSSDGARLVTINRRAVRDPASSITTTSYSTTVWDTASAVEVRTFAGAFIGISPDGKRIITRPDDDEIMVWDIASGAVIWKLGKESAIALSPDGNFIALSHQNDEIKILDITVDNKAFRTQKRLFDKDTEHGSWIGAFSPDNKYFAAIGMGMSVIKLWSVDTGRLLHQFETGVTNSTDPSFNIVFSPDSQTLVSGDEVPRLWSVRTGKEIPVDGRPARPTPRYTIKSFFSHDGKILANVLSGQPGANEVQLWDVVYDQNLRLKKRIVYEGNEAAFSANDTVLATVGDDQIPKLWDVKTGKQAGSLLMMGRDDWLVVAPDGRFDGNPEAWNKMLWRFQSSIFETALVETFFSEFYYPGLLADVVAGKLPASLQNIAQKDRRQPQLSFLPLEHSSETIAARQVSVRIEAADAPAAPERKLPAGGVRDLRLFRNGALVRVWRGDVLHRESDDGCRPSGQGRVICEATIPIVAGENRMTAYAFNNDNIKSADATFRIKGDQSLKRKGTVYILAVGVNEYANPEFNLKYAVPDAQDFGAEFERQQKRLERFERIEVVKLFDSDATKANILLAMRQLAGAHVEALPSTAPEALKRLKKTEPEDAVIVYFAGHGTAEGRRFYLIPHDIGYDGRRVKAEVAASLRTILEYSISDEELESAFERVDAGQLLLVIDACNSGQALEAEEKRRGPMNSKGLAQLAYEKGIYILTAAQSYQVARGAGRLGHGYLTYALIEEGLKMMRADEQPKDGQVMLREWLEYATNRVPRMQIESEEQRQLVQGAAMIKEEEVQRPRVFYRREPEAAPLIVAK